MMMFISSTLISLLPSYALNVNSLMAFSIAGFSGVNCAFFFPTAQDLASVSTSNTAVSILRKAPFHPIDLFDKIILMVAILLGGIPGYCSMCSGTEESSILVNRSLSSLTYF